MPKSGTVPTIKIYDATAVTVDTWVQLVAAASNPDGAKSASIRNGTDVPIQFGLGESGSEETWFYLGASQEVDRDLVLPADIRISYKSLAGTRSSGALVANFWR